MNKSLLYSFRKHKQSNLLYYIKGYFVMLLKKKYKAGNIQKKLEKIQKYDNNYIEYRVNYYNKLNNHTSLKNEGVTLKDFKYTGEHRAYFIDTFKYIRYFNPSNKLCYVFGDITEIPKLPSIVKSRPICDINQNSVLLKLNILRHYNFIKDKNRFENKKDKLVWRGKIRKTQPQRVVFFQKHFSNPLCNLGDLKSLYNKDWVKQKMTIEEQLQYKFILSIEGNDVATNLKWVMSSNSIAVMPKPKFETWFMEGTLIPDYHYICIKDDFSDLNEKLKYYIQNTDKALEIIKNAHNYVEQFKDTLQEDLISILVLKKYFDNVN